MPGGLSPNSIASLVVTGVLDGGLYTLITLGRSNGGQTVDQDEKKIAEIQVGQNGQVAGGDIGNQAGISERVDKRFILYVKREVETPARIKRLLAGFIGDAELYV